MLRNAFRFFVCAILTVATALATPQPTPKLVSPGNDRQEGRVGSECPTFSWAMAPGATGYTLAVWGVSAVADAASDTSSRPLIEAELPEGASGWTPSLGECLPGSGNYSWAVGAHGEDGKIHWSTPGLFRVVTREPERCQPAPTTPLAGVSEPILQSSSPPGVSASYPASESPRSITAEAFSPPACTGGVFSDVTLSHPLCAWTEKSAADQIVTACAAGRYCPDNPVTRSQLALFGERIMRGTDKWRPEAGDGATANTPPAVPTFTPLDTAGGDNTSITIGADGLGLISYQDGTSNDLNVAHCSDVNCTTATITPLDTAGNVGDFTSISIGADGLGLISYRDQTNLDLKVAHCADLDCAATTVPPTALDTAGNLGRYSSVTVGADGLGLISYSDFTNGDLKVAHCSNADCSAATITPLDTAGAVGLFTSITIGADGLGLISYHDSANGDLKAAHCSNINCSAGTNTTLDATGDMGWDTSVTIGADGFGLISYLDRDNLDLKVAHCANVLCAPYFRRR